MKNVIVFYIPELNGMADAYYKKNNKTLNKNLQEMKKTDIFNEFHIVTIQDPAREKVEVEIFFNPYQE